MARKQQKITTRSWVHKGGELVELKTLPEEERRQIGTVLAAEYFNRLYAGRAVFTVPDELKEKAAMWTRNTGR